MKRAALIVVALAALAAGGWYWYASREGDGELRYRTARVERGPIAAVVVASGTLNATTTVQVGSQISGQVKDIYADFNTTVKKDQVIARIDPSTFELRVNQARADLDSAQSAVKQRESLLKQAQVDLERTVIRAPVDGTVILRNVDAGQTVAASLQAPVLFTIAQDLRDMQVEAAIDEADVGRLRAGMAASFAVDAFPRRGFNGEIRQIRKSPLNVQNVVSYIVVISAANPDMALLPGMTANVRIAVENRTSALKVPNAALRWRPVGSAPENPKIADAPAQQAGGPAMQQFRARIQTDLKPSDAQRAQIEDIFNDSRQKFARVRDMKGDGERRREAERIRAESNARIAEILTAEQRPAWERLLAESGSRGPSAAGRLYVLENGQPKAVDVRLGLTDGTSTEVVGGLAEGAEVIIGTADARAGAPGASGGPRGRLF